MSMYIRGHAPFTLGSRGGENVRFLSRDASRLVSELTDKFPEVPGNAISRYADVLCDNGVNDVSQLEGMSVAKMMSRYGFGEKMATASTCGPTSSARTGTSTIPTAFAAAMCGATLADLPKDASCTVARNASTVTKINGAIAMAAAKLRGIRVVYSAAFYCVCRFVLVSGVHIRAILAI